MTHIYVLEFPNGLVEKSIRGRECSVHDSKIVGSSLDRIELRVCSLSGI